MHRRRFFLDGGMVLMYALSILVILGIVGLSMQETGNSLMQTSQESLYRRLAQHAADSGIRYGVTYIRGLLDPIPQYTSGDPGTGSIATHTSTPTGLGGNFPPVHPCNIFWFLMRTDIESWVRGGTTTSHEVERAPLDPSQPVGASNPPLYVTSFVLKVQAISVRPQGMIGQPSVSVGQVASVGLRWEDLVDQINQEYCHNCANPTPPQTMPPYLPPESQSVSPIPSVYYPPASPLTPTGFTSWTNRRTAASLLAPAPLDNTVGVTSTCFAPITSSAPEAKSPTTTKHCTFGFTQPYLLTSVGTVFINNPDNPGVTMVSASASVTSSQVITVSCKTHSPPSASTHSTYVVTWVNQER